MNYGDNNIQYREEHDIIFFDQYHQKLNDTVDTKCFNK